MGRILNKEEEKENRTEKNIKAKKAQNPLVARLSGGGHLLNAKNNSRSIEENNNLYSDFLCGKEKDIVILRAKARRICYNNRSFAPLCSAQDDVCHTIALEVDIATCHCERRRLRLAEYKSRRLAAIQKYLMNDFILPPLRASYFWHCPKVGKRLAADTSVLSAVNST